MRVKSLLVPPGIPDLYTRRRHGGGGPGRRSYGRAWSGGGVPIARVEVGIDGAWQQAELDAAAGQVRLARLALAWNAEPGEHELACRATDANGETQPLETRWDAGGFGNNVVQRVRVTVR